MAQGFITGIFLSLFCAASGAHAQSGPVRIVQNTIYHGDEVTDVQDGEAWVAIVPQGDQHFIARPVQISVTTVMDEVLDADKGPFTGKQISSLPDAVFLVAGLAIPSDHPLPVISRREQTLTSAHPVTLKGTGGPITLMAKGGEFAPDNGHISARPYLLSLQVQNQNIPLISATTLYEKTPRLLWAGDVNADGYPDLLLDISTHYNSNTPALFLSGTEAGRVTYRKVAQRTSSGC